MEQEATLGAELIACKKKNEETSEKKISKRWPLDMSSILASRKHTANAKRKSLRTFITCGTVCDQTGPDVATSLHTDGIVARLALAFTTIANLYGRSTQKKGR